LSQTSKHLVAQPFPRERPAYALNRPVRKLTESPELHTGVQWYKPKPIPIILVKKLMRNKEVLLLRPDSWRERP